MLDAPLGEDARFLAVRTGGRSLGAKESATRALSGLSFLLIDAIAMLFGAIVLLFVAIILLSDAIVSLADATVLLAVAIASHSGANALLFGPIASLSGAIVMVAAAIALLSDAMERAGGVRGLGIEPVREPVRGVQSEEEST